MMPIAITKELLIDLMQHQADLDRHIQEATGRQGQDQWSEKKMAARCEVFECMNEWQGFKFWKKDSKPRTYATRMMRSPQGHPVPFTTEAYNPMLEEYVDTVHFLLSLANDMDMQDGADLPALVVSRHATDWPPQPSTLELFDDADVLIRNIEDRWSWVRAFQHYLALGEALGFTGEQIMTAYHRKRQINHVRQDEGY